MLPKYLSAYLLTRKKSRRRTKQWQTVYVCQVCRDDGITCCNSVYLPGYLSAPIREDIMSDQ